MKIPQQLQKPEFRFVLLGEWDKWRSKERGEILQFAPAQYELLKQEKKLLPLGKVPFELKWQKKGYKYDAPKLLNHIKTKNYGIIGGYGNLRILDIDDATLATKVSQKLNTFTVETGGGGKHFYLISPYNKNHVLVNELGELRANNYQVVCPPCRHPSGNYYKVVKDIPIQNITIQELTTLLKDYLRLETSEPDSTIKPKDTSRSGLEYRKIVALLLEGKNKSEIAKEMLAYAKWTTAPEEYRDRTYQKALDYVKNKQDQKLEVYDDGELIKKEFPEPEWIIKDQIPKNEIGIMGGKRGERKSFYALYQSICASAGLDCVGDEVNKKHKVIFISEEDSILRLQARIKAIKRGLGIEKTKLDLKYFTENNLKLDKNNDTWDKFIKIFIKFKPDLVIVDTLQRCVSFDADKDNQAISEFMIGKIKPLQKKYGGAWFFIHHLRKGLNSGRPPDDLLDEVRGGSEIVNVARFVMICQLAKQSNELMVLTPVKMSYAELSEPKVISFVNSEEGLKVEYVGHPKNVLKTEIACGNAIMDFLFKEQIAEFQTKDIQEKAEEIGYKHTMITGGLKYLVERGDLARPKRGHYQVVGGKDEQLKI